MFNYRKSGGSQNLSYIYGCVGEKNKKEKNFYINKFLFLLIIKKDFFFIDKSGKVIIFFRIYDFIWIYMIILSKIETIKKNIKLKNKKITDLIYLDVIHHKACEKGGKCF